MFIIRFSIHTYKCHDILVLGTNPESAFIASPQPTVNMLYIICHCMPSIVFSQSLVFLSVTVYVCAGKRLNVKCLISLLIQYLVVTIPVCYHKIQVNFT